MLKTLMNYKEERESGFTLIELLVVILIIGILSAIAIPAFMNQRKSAVDSSLQSDIKNASTEYETWMAKNPHKPIENRAYTAQGGTTLAFISLAAALTPEKELDIKVSSGNVLHVYGGAEAGTYCIVGANKGGDVAAKDAMFFDSADGGLNNTGKACEANGGVATKAAKAIAAAENVGSGEAAAPGSDDGNSTPSGESIYGAGVSGSMASGEGIYASVDLYSNGVVVFSDMYDENMMYGAMSGSGTIHFNTTDGDYSAPFTLVDGKGTVKLNGFNGGEVTYAYVSGFVMS